MMPYEFTCGQCASRTDQSELIDLVQDCCECGKRVCDMCVLEDQGEPYCEDCYYEGSEAGDGE